MNSPATVNGLQSLQDEYALIDLGGEIRVIQRQHLAQIQAGTEQGELALRKRSEAALLMKRFLEDLPVGGKPDRLIQDFWVSPQTHMYTGIACSPLQLGPAILNYWIGPTAIAAQGSWRILEDFLLEIICADDGAAFDYLLAYLAHMLQQPEKKPGVMVVMLGSQGVGKGAFLELLRQIWGSSRLFVNDVERVVGKFNAALEQAYVVCMDEALFHGDRKSMDRMKSLITEPTISVEQKYQPSRSVDSYHRFFAASNNERFGNVERDDRRLLFLRVSDRKKGDSDYFTKLFAAIHNPKIVGAMVFDLLRLDLGQFNARVRPKTAEHLNQKMLSLTGFDRYWHEVLESAYFDQIPAAFAPLRKSYQDARFISTQVLTTLYGIYDKNAERHEPIQAKQICAALKRLCPSAVDARVTSDGEKSRGFNLPSLSVARREFEGYVGGSLSWE